MTINAAIFTAADVIDASAIDSLLDAMMTAVAVARDCGPIAWHDITLARARGVISDGYDGTRIVAIDMGASSVADALADIAWVSEGIDGVDAREAAADALREWIVAGTVIDRNADPALIAPASLADAADAANLPRFADAVRGFEARPDVAAAIAADDDDAAPGHVYHQGLDGEEIAAINALTEPLERLWGASPDAAVLAARRLVTGWSVTGPAELHALARRQPSVVGRVVRQAETDDRESGGGPGW